VKNSEENSMKMQLVTLLVPLSLCMLPTVVLAAVTDTGAGAATGPAAATGTLIATATVSAKCVITSTSNIVFAAIDPTSNGNYDGAGAVVTKCTKGTLEFLYVAPSVAGTLAMKSPTTLDSISYGLYSDAVRTTAFPSVSGGAKTTQPGSPVTTSIYGRVVVSSGVNDTIAAASDYTQALTVTIEW
jgi:spore coat protein U-like protein